MNFSDLESEKFTFHPEFTHQFFGVDEEIYGYKNLRIDIFMTAGSPHRAFLALFIRVYRRVGDVLAFGV